MKSYRVIWNLSGTCPYSCSFCATDSTGPQEDHRRFPGTSHASVSILGRQRVRSVNLDLRQKKAVVDNLKGIKAHIDFSGGDPWLAAEDRHLIAYATATFPKENVSVTTTGQTLSHLDDHAVMQLCRTIDITYDHPYMVPHGHRPVGYNRLNLLQGERFATLGVSVTAQVVMTPALLNSGVAEKLVEDLVTHRIKNMEVMRFMPVGRGLTEQLIDTSYIPTLFRVLMCTVKQHHDQITCQVQCALQGLNGNTSSACSMLERKLGIDPYGNLFACAWAANIDVPHQDNPFFLGSLLTTPVLDLIDSSHAQKMRYRLNSNQPHCKVFAYLFGGRNEEACFDRADPLYSPCLKSLRIGDPLKGWSSKKTPGNWGH